jgi:hypothetical protein
MCLRTKQCKGKRRQGVVTADIVPNCANGTQPCLPARACARTLNEDGSDSANTRTWATPLTIARKSAQYGQAMCCHSTHQILTSGNNT